MELYMGWMFISFIFLMIELFIPGTFVFLFLAIASILSGFFSFILELSAISSLIIFSCCTLCFIMIFHKRYQSYWSRAYRDDMNNSLSRLINSTGTVISIDHDLYKIKIGSHYWSARKKHPTHQIVLNSTVRVVGYHHMILMIDPIEPSSSDSQS
jgi:membrane protein implicated in regulation of membrane protease activity